jgi:hypothetical protein
MMQGKMSHYCLGFSDKRYSSGHEAARLPNLVLQLSNIFGHHIYILPEDNFTSWKVCGEFRPNSGDVG